MEVNKVSYAPDFQAKIIIGDERIQKFIKSSFMANSKATFETLDRFSEIYPVSINYLLSITFIKCHPNFVPTGSDILPILRSNAVSENNWSILFLVK